MLYTGKFKKAEIYDNTAGETPEQIKAKKGCTTIINGVLFNGDGSLCCDVRIDGKWIANDQYTYWGIGWSGNDIPQRVHTNDAGSYNNFLSCVSVRPAIQRGRAAIGFSGSEYHALAVADGADAMTIAEVEDVMEAKCDRYLILDGGGSAYLNCPMGIVDTSVYRKTANRTYILIWEDRKPLVCLDPGHGGNDTSNRAPDASYYEHEFTYNMVNRVKPLLERHGIDVMITRGKTESVALSERAARANAAGADLYVSAHSNALSGGWRDVQGLCVYTSSSGATAKRNIAARMLIARMAEAGVNMLGAQLYHAKFTVLTQTAMPAYLVEYGFHTNKEDVALLKTDAYRDKLATATAKAILDYFDIAWVAEDTGEEAQEQTESEVYRVQVGAFHTRAYAEALEKGLIADGYETIIV